MPIVDRIPALLPAFLLIISALTLVPLHSLAKANESQLAEIKSLLNWAVYLSKYEQPDELPELKFVDHEYLVLHACLGKPCHVIGWYNDNDIVYIDKALASLDSMLERSVVVHEMVHYLQHKSGDFSAGCSDSAMREREAYETQRQYFYAYGALSPIRMHEHYCAPDAHSGISDKQVEKHQLSSTE